MKACGTVLGLVLLLSVAAVCPAAASQGGEREDSATEEQVIALTYNCEFADALKLADRLDSSCTRSIRRDFFCAMVNWREYRFKGTAMIRDTSLEKEFRRKMTDVVRAGDAMLSDDRDNPVALFYTGAGLGYLGELDAMSGNYFKAAGEGSKALSYHRRLLSISPGWTDAYLTEGLFNLYTSSVPWYLEPVLFLLGKSGSRDLADRCLKIVAGNGRFAKYEAEESLALLYARQGKYDSVAEVYDRLSLKFPNAYFFYHRKLISALSDGRQYDQSITVCKAVIDTAMTFRLTHVDSLYLGLTYVGLSANYESLGRFDEAIRTYENMIRYHIAPPFHSWAHLSLGKLFEKVGDKKDAINQYEWVIRKDSVPQHVEEAKDRLKGLGWDR